MIHLVPYSIKDQGTDCAEMKGRWLWAEIKQGTPMWPANPIHTTQSEAKDANIMK